MIACINAVANEDQRRRSRMTDGLLLQVKLDHASGGKGPDLLARKGATAWRPPMFTFRRPARRCAEQSRQERNGFGRQASQIKLDHEEKRRSLGSHLEC